MVHILHTTQKIFQLSNHVNCTDQKNTDIIDFNNTEDCLTVKFKDILDLRSKTVDIFAFDLNDYFFKQNIKNILEDKETVNFLKNASELQDDYSVEDFKNDDFFCSGKIKDFCIHNIQKFEKYTYTPTTIENVEKIKTKISEKYDKYKYQKQILKFFTYLMNLSKVDLSVDYLESLDKEIDNILPTMKKILEKESEDFDVKYTQLYNYIETFEKKKEENNKNIPYMLFYLHLFINFHDMKIGVFIEKIKTEHEKMKKFLKSPNVRVEKLVDKKN